ncbi:hypothetical protein [Azospirillum largimobile]
MPIMGMAPRGGELKRRRQAEEIFGELPHGAAAGGPERKGPRRREN